MLPKSVPLESTPTGSDFSRCGVPRHRLFSRGIDDVFGHNPTPRRCRPPRCSVRSWLSVRRPEQRARSRCKGALAVVSGPRCSQSRTSDQTPLKGSFLNSPSPGTCISLHMRWVNLAQTNATDQAVAMRNCEVTVNSCVTVVRRRLSLPLPQRRFHPRIVRRGRRPSSVRAPATGGTFCRPPSTSSR